MSQKVLKNVAFRVVGNYLRVNKPFSDAVPPPAGFPAEIEIEELTVDYNGAHITVKDVMNAIAVAPELQAAGVSFSFSDLPNGKNLDEVTVQGHGRTLSLSSRKVTSVLQASGEFGDGNDIGAAWQYYIFEDGDERLPVTPARAPYGESPEIDDGYRIIWRLVVVYRSEGVDQGQIMRARLST